MIFIQPTDTSIASIQPPIAICRDGSDHWKRRNVPVQDTATGADRAFAGDDNYETGDLPAAVFDSMVPAAYNAVTVKIGGMKEGPGTCREKGPGFY